MLRKLEVLDLSYNKIQMLPAPVFKLPKLRVLAVGHNRLKKFPSQLVGSSVEQLIADHNQIVEIDPKAMDNLTKLVISYNPIKGILVDHYLPKLRYFDFRNTELEELGLKYLSVDCRFFFPMKQSESKEEPIESKQQTSDGHIFISHSSKDTHIIRKFVEDILRLGVNLAPEHIRCSSIEGYGIKNGEDMRRWIREEITNCSMAFLMISPNYQASQICLNEMGAIWALNKQVKLFLLPGIDTDNFGWLEEVRQAGRINDSNVLDELYDTLAGIFHVEKNISDKGQVAIVGSGPSGLTAAGDLARMGYDVTVFEALHVAGGVLVYGIPEFRLPKKIVSAEIENLKALGVRIETNMVIGKVLTVDDLFERGFKAVYIGSGAGLPRFMNIPGESLKGVYSANEYLTRINLMKAYKENSKTPILRSRRVAVVGGGNEAMDAARSAKRLGAETVYIVYRRGMDELPARREEIEHALEEGVVFKTLTNPIEVVGNEQGFVCALRCVEMGLGEPDESGRRRPVAKEGSEFELAVDAMIVSVGTSPNPLLRQTTPGMDTDSRGCIITSGVGGQTSREGVFAGGDAVTGAATVILAMGAGKQAAKAIDEYIQNSK